MEIGARIKSRRLELELSVDDLASRIGKNRATIYRYEKGDIENLPVSVIEPLAKALYTTPEYLMGWTNDPIDHNNPIYTTRHQKLGITAEQFYRREQNLAKRHDFLFNNSELFPLLREVYFGVDLYDPYLVETYIVTDLEDWYPPEMHFWFRCPDESLQDLGIPKDAPLFFMREDRIFSGPIALLVIRGEDAPILGEIESLENAIVIHPKNRNFRSRTFIGKDMENVQLLGELRMAKIYF